MSKSRVILAFDPGTNHTGYAKLRAYRGKVSLSDAGILRPSPKIKKAENKVKALFLLAEHLLKAKPYPTEVWVEDYKAFGARKGQAGMNQLKGALLTLETERVKVRTVMPGVWKDWIAKEEGILDSKEAVQKRLRELGQPVPSNEHALDAAGVALWAMEVGNDS